MVQQFQFDLKVLFVAVAYFAVGAMLLAIGVGREEPLALWWSLPFMAIGLGLFKGHPLRYGLIGAAVALFLSIIVMV